MAIKIVDTFDVNHSYGFKSTAYIFDVYGTKKMDGRYVAGPDFGGMSSVRGGCVRWEHGYLYQVPTNTTKEDLFKVCEEYRLPGTTLWDVIQLKNEYQSDKPGFLIKLGERLEAAANG